MIKFNKIGSVSVVYFHISQNIRHRAQMKPKEILEVIKIEIHIMETVNVTAETSSI